MKRKELIRGILFFPLVLFCVVSFSQDNARVWVHMDVHAIYEEHFLAGDPPQRVNISSDITFTHSGMYTINRTEMGSGYHYFSVQDIGTTGHRAMVPSLKVIQTHPCQEGQGFLIGKAEKEIPAELYKAAVSLGIRDAGNNRVKIQFWPVEIYLDASECSNPQCLNGFGFMGLYDIGADPESVMQFDDVYADYDDYDDYDDEYDYDDYENDYVEITGYDLMEVDFNLLRNMGAGQGDIPLSLPINVNKTHREVHDTPTGPVEHVYTFRVTGWIGTPPSGR
jgi:hypothetical protein